MDSSAQLEKARELLDNNEPKAAIKLLKPLYRANPTNPEIIEEVATAFELMEQWENARGMLAKAIRLNPADADLWIRLSQIYQIQQDLDSAIKALDKGLSHNQDDLALLTHKANLLASDGKVEEMRSLINHTIANYPEHENELIIERAFIYESIARQPTEEEEQIKDLLGMRYSVKHLTAAIADLTQALELDEINTQINLRRAQLYRLLGDYDHAISDYDEVLGSLDDENEAFRDFVQNERDKCLNGGRNEREQLASSLKEGLVNLDQKSELSQQDLLENSIMNAIAGQIEGGQDILSTIENMDDPDHIVALSIAQDILRNAREPDADFIAVNKVDYDKAAQKFCEHAETVLSSEGFSSLGDFEPLGLGQQIGQRILLRIFTSDDQRSCAAAFRIKPPRPPILQWLFLIVTGKWKSAQIVELESETQDGKFIITNNSGDLNPFNAGDAVDMLSLPLKTKIKDLVSTHRERINPYGEKELIQLTNAQEIFSMQERLRILKNDYRASIGFVTDMELKKMLGKQYDKYAGNIRKYLQQLTTDLC